MKHTTDISETHLRNKITLITFVCSMFVIWIHTFNLATYGITGEGGFVNSFVFHAESYWSNLTNKVAVPTFFVISGFLFFRTYIFKDTVKKYKSRIKSVLIPYICWASIYYLYYVAITNIPVLKSLISSSESVPLSPLNWLSWLWPNEYYTLWFLKNLLVFILISPLLYILLKNRGKFPVGIPVILLILLNGYFKWVDFGILNGLGEYAFGCYIAINHKEITMKKNKYFSYAGIVYILFQLLTSFRWFNIFAELLFIVSVWAALDIFDIRKKLPWWMSITFFVYVSHDLILECAEKLIYVILPKNAYIAFASFVVTPIAVFIIIVLIAAFMKRFTPHLWKVLSGNR